MVICFVVGLILFACLRPLELLLTVLQVKFSLRASAATTGISTGTGFITSKAARGRPSC